MRAGSTRGTSEMEPLSAVVLPNLRGEFPGVGRTCSPSSLGVVLADGDPGAFLSHDSPVELAVHASGELRCESASRSSVTQSPRDCPTHPSRIPASVESVTLLVGCSWANSQFRGSCSANLSSTSHGFPAVLDCHALDAPRSNASESVISTSQGTGLRRPRGPFGTRSRVP